MIGKVLDSSAVSAIAGGDTVANSWMTVSWDNAHIVYVPELATIEVRALRPDLAPAVDDLTLHPSVIVRTLTDPAEAVAAAVEALLTATGTYDVLAGHAVHVATTRGWSVVTADAARLRRLAPGVELTLI